MSLITYKNLIDSDCQIVIETDYYVCMNVSLDNANRESRPSFYWRSYVEQYSLLEMEIDSENHYFKSFTLTLFKGSFKWKKPDFDLKASNCFEGLPQFNLMKGNTASNVFTSQVKPDVFMENNSLLINFGMIEELTFSVKYSNLLFLFNLHKQFVGFEVNNMSSSQVEDIYNYAQKFSL